MKKPRPVKERIPAARAKRTVDRLLRQLPDLDRILRGTLVERWRRCGRPTCRCARKGERGHGPAYYLMITVASRKTMLVYVPPQHKEKVQAWVDNFRRTRETLEEISTLNRELLRQGDLFGGG